VDAWEIDCEDVGWFELVQDLIQSRALINISGAETF
jgi:hypothetical protein